MLKAIATPSYTSIIGAPETTRSLPKIACIGSSYTSQQLSVSGTVFSETNRSWMKWWHIFSHGAFNMDNFVNASDTYSRGHSGSNFGWTGQTSTQILARIPDVIAANPAICILQSGTNNVTAVSTVIADVKESIDKLYAAGILPVYLSINNRGSASWASNEPSQAFQINQTIKDYMKRTGKGMFIESNAYLLDNSAATGRPYTNALDSDGIHYNNYSGFQIGKLLHQCLTPILPLLGPELCSITDVYDATYNPYGNFTTNPFFSTDSGVGSGGGSVGTGVTAGTGTGSTSVCRSFTVERNSGSGTAVATLEARGAGRGNWQVGTFTPAGSAGTSVFYMRRSSADLTTNVPPVGTWVQASLDVDVSAFGTDTLYSGFRSVAVVLDFRNASSSLGKVETMTPYSTSYNLPNEAWTGRIYTQPFLIPTSCDRIRYRAEINADDAMTGTGVVKIGSWCFRPVQEPRTIWGF